MPDITHMYITFLAIGEILLFLCFVFCIYQNRVERWTKKTLGNLKKLRKGEDTNE